MKAIVLGVGVGLLALVLLVRSDSTAEADCENCPSPGDGSFGALAAHLNVDNNFARNFEDDGSFNWCLEDFEPTAGAVRFEVDDSAFVNSVSVTPSFLDPSGCIGGFPVTVDGKLNVNQSTGTCVIYGFAYQPPLVDDDHTFTVHEL